MSIRTLLILLFTTALFAISVEFVSFSILCNRGNHEPFLLSKPENPKLWNGKYKAYNVVDPLLGWAINPDTIASRGFAYKKNTIYLEPNVQETNPIRIYITGGSTSDLIFDQNNWPHQLKSQFEEHDIPAEIYVGAVGGYNSGQEVLKTLRDINKIKPDYHISYSGANEVDNGSYTTYFERELFKKLYDKRFSGLFPNVKKLLLSGNTKTSIYEDAVEDNYAFWRKNILAMHALSIQNNYKFIGILQPVINYGSDVKNKTFDKDVLDNFIEGYSTFYPKAISFADSSECCYNFTQVFNAYSSELIFSDDCHLIDEKYQKIIARSIFTKLTEIEHAK